MKKMSRSESGFLGAKKTHQVWIARYWENPKQCKNCQITLPYEKRNNKFCDNSCSASYNNKLRVKKKKSCLFCNELCKVKYCSNECQGKDRWRKTKDEIEKTGKAVAVSTAKRYLLEQSDICKVCGIKEWQDSELVLVLDHINGNSSDWRIVNLRLLCPNCDSQTLTYKGKNRGSGRYARRMRYARRASY